MRNTRQQYRHLLIRFWLVIICFAVMTNQIVWAQEMYQGQINSGSRESIDVPENGTQSDVETIRIVNTGSEIWYPNGPNALSINYRWEWGDSGDRGNSDSHFWLFRLG